jgi:hypothetical protein
MQSIARALRIPLEDLIASTELYSSPSPDSSANDATAFRMAIRELTEQMSIAMRQILEGYATAIQALHEIYKSSDRKDR